MSGGEEKDESLKEEPFKDGQKKPTPPAADATRVFYESLFKQKPESKMAMSWCVQHGVLDDANLKTALKKLGKDDE